MSASKQRSAAWYGPSDEYSGCKPPSPVTCSFILQHDCFKVFLEQEDEPEMSNQMSSLLVLVALIFSTVFDTTNPPAHIFSLLPPSFSSSLILAHPSFICYYFCYHHFKKESILCQIFSQALPFPFRGCGKLKPESWRVEEYFILHCLY